jgi:AcrR family transcriptional regulator
MTVGTSQKEEQMPPRARILAVASDLFYRQGIRAVGVEAIAEAARTNKMTLYRHFSSKDELVAEYLRQAAQASDACWGRFAQAHPGDALAQLRAWLAEMAGHIAAARWSMPRSSYRTSPIRRGGSLRNTRACSAPA